MPSQSPSYHGYRFPPEIISHAVWLYHRFCLSFRDVEDLLAQRGIPVSYETIRHWGQTFGVDYARKLRRRRGVLGDTWFLDEVFVTIHGRRQYLWRAVDQDADLLDILVQSRRDPVRTIERRSRINRRASASGRCVDSNPPRTRSGFSRYTDSCRTSSVSAVTCSERFTTGR